MLLAQLAFATSLALGTPSPAPTQLPTPSSHLPLTQPGSGPDEGVFLVTTADDGSRAAYFIAGNSRHSILPADMQTELRLNPLWPVHTVSADEVLAFDEGAPVGKAPVGVMAAPADDAVVPPAAAAQPQAASPEPTQPAAPKMVEAPTNDAPVAADDEDTAENIDDGDAQAATTYTVKRGDSAFLIARQFGVSQNELLAANGIRNANRVYVGQVLSIPQS